MLSRVRSIKPPVLGLLVCSLLSAPVQALSLRVSADRVNQGPVDASGLRLSLIAPDQPGAGLGLQLQVDSLDIAGSGYAFRGLDWRCELRPSDVATWHCAGPLRSDAGAAGELALDWRDGDSELILVRGRARLVAGIPGSAASMTLQAERLPAGWLQPLLGALWTSARFTGGTLAADLEMDFGLSSPRVEGSLRADGLGLDTTDGLIAAADLNLQGRLGLELGEQTRITTELALTGGEILFGPVYASLPAQPVQFKLGALGAGSRWALDRLLWNDPGVLSLEASASIDTQAEEPLPDLRLDLRSTRADVLTSRYLESLLASAGLPGLQVGGALQLRVDRSQSALRSLEVEPEALRIEDPGGRFALGGAGGRLHWTRSDAVQDSSIGWQSAALYGIELGAAQAQLRSVQGAIELREPLQVAMLDGQLGIDALRWRPADANPAADAAPVAASDNLALSLRLQDLDLAALSARFGWPAFSGRMSGVIPGVQYRDGVFSLDGEIAVQVFDGEVKVSALRLERPFGVAPTLGADVEVSRLDLKPLTSVFGFGEITGRLQGYIRALRLVDWEPVAFDARFETDQRAPDKRRISQRAVRDLSSVGGMGATAALQAGVMRAFENFPYARIGIACRLENHTCHMGGVSVSGSGRGYTIVEGSGLPRITVNGIQREVDWPVLVSRLRAVTEGQTLRFD
jgi:hypothetical protein